MSYPNVRGVTKAKGKERSWQSHSTMTAQSYRLRGNYYMAERLTSYILAPSTNARSGWKGEDLSERRVPENSKMGFEGEEWQGLEACRTTREWTLERGESGVSRRGTAWGGERQSPDVVLTNTVAEDAVNGGDDAEVEGEKEEKGDQPTTCLSKQSRNLGVSNGLSRYLTPLGHSKARNAD
ncbi:hypothetical protein FB451DRAFT_1179520 [Mycena latifolia]|nr:hypothetical protein FB451DRAFT_1179520 [Mycena latifolia]